MPQCFVRFAEFPEFIEMSSPFRKNPNGKIKQQMNLTFARVSQVSDWGLTIYLEA